MKGYRIILTFVLFVTASLPLFLLDHAVAQERGPGLGGFLWGGSVELGYRLTDIDGRDRYKEVVNLMEGLRLFDFNLYGNNPNKNTGVDFFQLSATGIGDPFPSARLQVKKDKAYDVTATYRESKYFFARQDDDVFGPTDTHDFNQKRRRASLTVALFPKEDIRLNFGYGYSDRRGDANVPRADFVIHEQDLNERLDQYFVSADLPVGNWDLHVKQAFWTFRNRNEIEDASLSERRKEKINTYVSTIKGHTKLNDRWDFDLGYVFAHSEGRADLASGPTIEDVTPGSSKFNSNIHVVEMGLSHLLLTNLIAHFDYRFHVERKDGSSDTDPVLTSPDFNQHAHTGTFQLEYLPTEKLTVRGGYRLQYRDINGDNVNVNENDGGKDVANTTIWTHGWIASADWKPSKVLSFYGEYQGAEFDNPYTRISPEHENIAKVKVRYKPVKDLSASGIFSWKKRTNPDQSYRVNAQDYTFALNYQPAAISGLSFDGSFTFERILDKKDILLDDSTLQRFVFDSNALIWTGGVTYEGIYKGLGARLTGSYAKTYKENHQRYADAILSFWYKNKCVTPVISLERTYLSDHVRPKDSFNANLLTFSLRKDF